MDHLFYHQNIVDVFRELLSSDKGLTEKEAKSKLQSFGPNALKEQKGTSPIKLFFSQFNNAVVYILIAALIISSILPFHEHPLASLTYVHFIDTIVIATILILNAILGFVQEFKAEKAIAALKAMASPKAKVIRDGKEMEIDSRFLVPGDIIVIEEGDKIPADARILEAIELNTQEAALTGESTPVKKSVGVVDRKKGVADQWNMLFAGTIITQGKGKAIITSTGMKTEIGKIADLIQKTETTRTPLQQKLQKLGSFLGWLVVVIAIVVFMAGIVKGHVKFSDLFLASIALAVAAIPEGLPAVVTISLALGVKRMIKRNALIRKLPSVETLGSTSVICTDKTGTLTCNEMTVKRIFANNNIIDVTGEGYATAGSFTIDGQHLDPSKLSTLLEIGCLTNNAKLLQDNHLGDPTEVALIVSAEKAGFKKEALESKFPRLHELPFSSERKTMATLHKNGAKTYTYIKGAVDVLLKNCNRILIDNKVRKLAPRDKKNILETNETFAKEALRVLACAYKESKIIQQKDLIFVGMQAMIDPPRPKVQQAIATCHKAGIRVIMITGDHATTALAIAKELGIAGSAMTGEEIDKIKKLENHMDHIGVFARVNPEHKTKIISALRKQGKVIAMTGDGVNDAPALKNSDIGIAMGITGTDVAKEASDMILTDDNFTSIVHAVEEGRGIYDNIKKFVAYLLSSNLGEVLTIFFAIILSSYFGNALPLIAVQILWINLITDGLPALALSLEPVEKDIMLRKPRPKREKIVTRSSAQIMILVGLIMMVGTLSLFRYELSKPQALQISNHPVVGTWNYKGSYFDYYQQNPLTNNQKTDDIIRERRKILFRFPQTMAFTVLMMFQMFNVLNCRSEKKSLFTIGLFQNKPLWVAIGISLALHMAVLYTPLANFFKTAPLQIMDWLLVIAVSSSVFFIIELVKGVEHIARDR